MSLNYSKHAFVPRLQALIDAALLAMSQRPELQREVSALLTSVEEKAAAADTQHCLSCDLANWQIQHSTLVQRGCGKYIPLPLDQSSEATDQMATAWMPVFFCSQFQPGGGDAAGELPPSVMGVCGAEAEKPSMRLQQSSRA